MVEVVTKCIKDSKETVTLCYRDRLNRPALLPRRVGKVLRANSRALALARGVKALRGSAATEDADTVGGKEGERHRAILLFLSIHDSPNILVNAGRKMRKENRPKKVFRNNPEEETWQSWMRIRAATDAVQLDCKLTLR